MARQVGLFDSGLILEETSSTYGGYDGNFIITDQSSGYGHKIQSVTPVKVNGVTPVKIDGI